MKEMGLKVIIEPSSKVIDYLDIELDLTRGVVKPYHKPNNITKYVHKDSNHPPHVINNLPVSVQKRISSISSNKEIFEQNITRYQEAIDKAGYNVKLEYNENDMKKIEKEAKKQNNADHNSEKKQKRKRTRNIIYYNPPYNQLVQTNLSYEVRKIIKKNASQKKTRFPRF